MYSIKKVLRKGRLLVASAVLGFGIATGVAIIDSALPSQTNAATKCDKVNIIYCGHSGSTTSAKIKSVQSAYNNNKSGHRTSSIGKDYTDIRTVYNWFGVSSSTINGMSTSNTKIGTLYRNGDVKVDGKLVGTGAEVSARFSVSGAKKISGTNVWVRKTTSSFANDKVQVIVHFKSGKMTFAVMLDCGNVVKAKPVEPPKPPQELKCVELKAVPTTNKNEYRFTAKGSATNGASIKSYTFNFGDGQSRSTASNATTYKYSKSGTFTATVHVDGTLNGKSVSKTATNCKVAITIAPPKQTLKCVELRAVPTDKKNEFRFVATGATTNGGTINSYSFNFGDGSDAVTVDSSNTSAETTHTYSQTGEFTATLNVTGKVNGKTETVTAPACRVKITITPDEKLACVNLTATPTDVRNQYVFRATAQALNGATIQSYTFNFGDDSDEAVVNSTSETAETTYTYETEGDFTATVHVNGTVNGEAVSVTDGECEAKVTSEEEEEPCPVPGKEHLPKDSDKCVEDEEEVLGKEVELPKTGAGGAAVALFGVTSALGALGHRLYISRRLK